MHECWNKNKNKPFVDRRHLKWMEPREPGKNVCASWNFFLTVRSGLNSFLLGYEKHFYTRNVRI